jgi:hypothetical protein
MTSLNFEIKYIDKPFIDDGTGDKSSSFKYLDEIELRYIYVGEFNNGIVTQDVELLIKGRNIISDLGIDKRFRSIHGFPHSFELLNNEKTHHSIPHGGGIYILDLTSLSVELLSYSKFNGNKYVESFYYDQFFILVGKGGFLMYNVLTGERHFVDYDLEEKEYIRTLKIINEKIVAVSNKHIIISEFKDLKQNCPKKYQLNKCISDSSFKEEFQIVNTSNMSETNNFKYRNTIDSFRPVRLAHDRIIGHVSKYDDCIVDEKEAITRKRHSNYIEILIKE